MDSVTPNIYIVTNQSYPDFLFYNKGMFVGN